VGGGGPQTGPSAYTLTLALALLLLFLRPQLHHEGQNEYAGWKSKHDLGYIDSRETIRFLGKAMYTAQAT
jgi:hypothetical protein